MSALDDIRNYLHQMTVLRKTMGEPPKGYYYLCAEDYVLDRGEVFASEPLTDEELAHLLAVAEAAEDLFGEYGFLQKQCFANAAKLAMADDSGQLAYTEGYAQGAFFAVAHAWVSLNGKTIDLTWRLDERSGEHRFSDRVLGTIPDDRAYLGIEFPTDYLRERVLETETFLSLLTDYKADYPLFREERLSPPNS